LALASTRHASLCCANRCPLPFDEDNRHTLLSSRGSAQRRCAEVWSHAPRRTLSISASSLAGPSDEESLCRREVEMLGREGRGGGRGGNQKWDQQWRGDAWKNGDSHITHSKRRWRNTCARAYACAGCDPFPEQFATSLYTLIFHLRLLLSFSPRISATLGLQLMPLGAPASPSAHTVASGVATMRFGRRAQQHATSVPPPHLSYFVSSSNDM